MIHLKTGREGVHLKDGNIQQAFKMADPTVKVRLMAIAGMWGTFAYTNSVLKKTVRKSSTKDALHHNGLSFRTRTVLSSRTRTVQSSCTRTVQSSCTWTVLSPYSRTVLYMTANIGCVYYAFQEQQLWNVFIFQLPSYDESFLMVLWAVCVNDFVLKHVTVIIKAFLSMAPIKPKRRGKCYKFVEHLMQLYRMTIPIVPWVHYLTDGRSWVFASGLRCVYIMAKGSKLPSKVNNVRNAFVSLVRKKIYGVKPKLSHLDKRSDGCPICQDDFNDPIRLDCKHIFCDSCVTKWFKQKRICPMCRATIYTGCSKWEDASTSFHIQWY